MIIKDEGEYKLSSISQTEQSDSAREYLHFLEMRKNKKNRNIIIVWSLIATIFSLSLFLVPANIDTTNVAEKLSRAFNSGASLSIVISVMAVSFGSFLFNYLKPTSRHVSKQNTKDLTLEIALSRYERKLETLNKKFESIISALQSGDVNKELFKEDEKQKILQDIKARLESETFEEYLSELKKAARDEINFKSCEDIFKRTIHRLEAEIESQTKRGNLNLFLGIITTLIGVAILSYSVFQAPLLTSDIEIASHFLPRLSLVVLIEVFAYFFLRLYKQSLDEIKYFQNEITNIENKYLGSYLATELPATESISSVIHHLMSTERNFILDKGQSTAQIELKKIESSTLNDTSTKLNSALSNLIKR